MSSWLDLLGWLGGGLGAVAYVLVSTRRIMADAVLFQGLNMVGAALLCIASFHSGALPSACMNIAWILFGVQSLVMTNQRRRRAASAPPRVVQVQVPAPETGDLAGAHLVDAVCEAA